MKKRLTATWKRAIAFAACLAALLGVAVPCLAEDGETETVKVGFFAFAGYHEQSEDGARSGYGYEMLQHLAGYAGFRYEYVGYDKSWSQMQDMLANGEIDLLTSAQKTPEREARFDFSATNIGVSAAILTARAGDTKFMEADYGNWDGIRVGMIEGNSRNDSFADYAAEHGFTYVPVYFGSTDEMLTELQSVGADKRIDAILTSNLRKTENEWVLAQFASSPFFVMVKKGNTALLDRVDRAIAQLDACEPGFRTKLMNKYYATDNGGEIAFTAEERAYIEKMQGHTFTALINPDRAPYSWAENGALKGVLYDAAQDIIARSGLNVVFLTTADRAAYWHMISEGTADIRFDVVNSYNQAEADGYWLTNPYVTVPIARLYLKKTRDFHTAAAPANRDITDNYAKSMEKLGLAVTYYDSVDETVQAILDEKQDVAFLAMDSATMAIRDDVTNKLAMEEMFGDEISYAVAVNASQSPQLFSILSKAVASLGEKDIDAIRQNYTANLEKKFTLLGYFYEYPIHVLLAAVAVLSVVIMLVIIREQAKRRKAERTHLLKEQQQNELLRDALAAAEKAGEAKSQFLSRVSHEMRTPLNAIIGFIELGKGADREQMENYLASSDLAAKQLLNVINDVLDMSSIESGKLKIASAPFNFKHLVSSITNIYGTQCRQKGVGFETKIITPVDDWMAGDELRVNQILMNLLGNAVKFTTEGHIWLTISQLDVSDEKLFLRFEIADTGCGMSEEMKERLFKPFEQESTATAKNYGGSGLGLSIVKNLAGMMSGSVRVESQQGKGTTFTVDLPFERSEIETEAVLPDKVASLRILAVDDEQGERDYMATVLARMGVRFTCVSSGGEALETLEQAEKEGDLYNVCLIDWRMPEMDGVDTTSRIREKYGKDVIVIVVSAYDFQQAGDSARGAGANLFISKPIFQSTLFDLLMTLTGGEIAKTAEEPQNWDFAGRRVLLVEDNTLNQIVAKGYLAKYNVVVDLAENGQIAVDKFLASEPGWYDAILMDIQMPVMDGYEATKAIRESGHPDAGTVQIIAQTADAFNEDIARALNAGMNAHVGKPIKPSLLAKALYTAFAAHNKAE